MACYDQPKLIANVLISEVLKLKSKTEDILKISPEDFAGLIRLIDTGIINTSIAKKVIDMMW